MHGELGITLKGKKFNLCLLRNKVSEAFNCHVNFFVLNFQCSDIHVKLINSPLGKI